LKHKCVEECEMVDIGANSFFFFFFFARDPAARPDAREKSGMMRC